MHALDRFHRSLKALIFIELTLLFSTQSSVAGPGAGQQSTPVAASSIADAAPLYMGCSGDVLTQEQYLAWMNWRAWLQQDVYDHCGLTDFGADGYVDCTEKTLMVRSPQLLPDDPNYTLTEDIPVARISEQGVEACSFNVLHYEILDEQFFLDATGGELPPEYYEATAHNPEYGILFGWLSGPAGEAPLMAFTISVDASAAAPDELVNCVLPDGGCELITQESCDAQGGVVPSVATCLGDNNGNGVDDALEGDATRRTMLVPVADAEDELMSELMTYEYRLYDVDVGAFDEPSCADKCITGYLNNMDDARAQYREDIRKAQETLAICSTTAIALMLVVYAVCAALAASGWLSVAAIKCFIAAGAAAIVKLAACIASYKQQEAAAARRFDMARSRAIRKVRACLLSCDISSDLMDYILEFLGIGKLETTRLE